jgi:uncharacterized delta-60 repeat protein
MKALLRMYFFVGTVILATHYSHAQVVDPGFPITDVYQPATVRAVLRQADGKYLVGGSFLKINGIAIPSGLIRLNADGSIDQQFTTTAAVQTAPYALRQLPSGRILLFSPGTITVAGQSFRNLVQLNPDGTLGPALATGTGSPGGSGRVVAVQPDGKILLGGLFTSFNGVASPYFVRLNTDGTVDTQFTTNLGTGFTGGITAMLVQPDGKIVVGGRFQNFNGTGRRLLVRLLADGSYDSSFVPVVAGPSYAFVAHIALDPRNNDIVIEGAGLQNQSGTFQSMLRLTSTGSQDPQFLAGSGQGCYLTDYGGNDQLAIDTQGRIVQGGCFERFNGRQTVVNSSLVRLLPTGAPDPQFPTGPTLLGSINHVLLEPNGRVVVAGNFKKAVGTDGASIVRLESNAQPDTTFQAQLLAAGQINKLLTQPDGKILLAGRFTDINGLPASNVARLNANGSRDATFVNSGPDYTVESIALQPDGRILVGGNFKAVAANTAPLVARLQANGAYDATFTTSIAPLNASDDVSAIVVQADGNVVIGGSSLSFAGGARGTLHRLLSNGQLDQAYEANVRVASSQIQVLSLALLPDGRLYSGGFYSPSNAPTYTSPALIRLNNDGTLDPTFALPASGTELAVFQVLPLAGGQVLAAGRFANYNGVPRVNMVRLNANGTVDTGFNANINYFNLAGADIYCVVPQPNGRLLIGSTLSIQINGVNQGPLVRLLPDGTLDTSFAANSTLVNGYVYGAAVQVDGGIVVAGQFERIAGQPRVSLARLTAPQVLVAARSAAQTATTSWPVPARSWLYVAADLAQHPSDLTLFDMQGRRVLSMQPVQAVSKLDIRRLPAGVYLLRVDYADGPVTRRVIVQ